MTIRIPEPNLYHTKTLVEQILVPVIRESARVAFLCDSGTGENVIARVRVYMSRHRKKMLAKGKKVKQFQLHATVHPETHDGKRHDCVVMWQSVTDSQRMAEDLDDLLAIK